MHFLPLTKKEAAARGWDTIDFVCVTGDAYVDHPSFGIAIIARLLESLGHRVAVIAQPGGDSDFARFGRPRLGFFVTGGNIDSMVSHYTAAGRKRSDDPYTPGNKAGRRPDRATVVYSQKIRALYGGCPIIIGGLEASFRRFAHYDCWENKVRPSILVDSGADLLVYGMGERQTREIAGRLAGGEDISSLSDIRGTAVLRGGTSFPKSAVSCAAYQKVAADKAAFARAFKMQMDEQDHITGRAIIQGHGDGLYLVQNPPAPPLSQDELDAVFALPFMRGYHPSYERQGGVKAIEEVGFSIIHNRGCFGGCSFCSIAFHQGRSVTARSVRSVLEEGRGIASSPRFKGYIHDVGGPTANFRGPACKVQLARGVCNNRRCLAPNPCKNLEVDHREYLEILRGLRKIPGVKKVFVRSGLRYDYILADPDPAFLRELVEHHTSGQLKVAPEHCAPRLLALMGKPRIEVFERFAKAFYAACKKAGKEQYLVPYLISSHPGSTIADAIDLAVYLKKMRIRPEQVQDFYPTPGTASTCMFHTGIDPATGKPVYIPNSREEKAAQRALLQYYKPENRELIARILRKAGRADLIGSRPDCLIPGGGQQKTKPERRGRHAGKK
ncbi:MAG: YgiQ family radical SAM protein [Oscillospiraceae bacterium]|nr:YgiQ family radical SAM protein [Oscillospiraceae bacterium]